MISNIFNIVFKKTNPSSVGFKIKNVCLLSFFLFPFFVFSQQKNHFEQRHKKEIIIVSGSGSIEKNVSINGKSGDSIIQTKIFYHNHEKISDLEAKYLSASMQTISPDQIIDQEESDKAFSGFRSKSLKFKSNVYFEYKYKLFSNDLFTLNSLDFFSDIKTDTFTYVIEIPKGFNLIFEPSNIESEILNFSIDSIKGIANTTYNFRAIRNSVGDSKTIYQSKQSVDKKNKFPRVKIFVFPKQYSNNPNAYLNDSYLKIVKPTTKLTRESLLFFENIFDKLQFGDSFVFNLYDIIKTKITLINQNSFVKYPYPQDVNITLTNKSGNEKDLANLLCEIFKHFGFDAHLVFASSAKTGDDLDFPGLSNVKKLICAIKLNNKWVYINPSEQFYGVKVPPLSIQGKHVLITTDKGGEIQIVEKVKIEYQKIDFNLDILYEDFFDNLNGTYDFKDNNFVTNKKNHDTDYQQISNNDTLRTLEEFTQGLKFLNYSCKKEKNFLSLTGDIALPRKFIIKLCKRNYFSLKFLPFPHNLSRNVSEEEFIYLRNQNNNNLFKIRFLYPVKLYEEIHSNFQENGLKFNFDIIQSTDKEIEIKYTYLFEEMPDKEKQFKTYNKLNSFIIDAMSKMFVFDRVEDQK